MSGTSIDGIDAVLVEIKSTQISTVTSICVTYPNDTAMRLRNVLDDPGAHSLEALAKLNIEVGRLFADAANQVLAKSNASPADVIAIGSHGQTLWHKPSGNLPFSVQIADPATIAARSGITTVADFRSLDIAYGGSGAPIVPAFHDWLFHNDLEDRVVINIGGIANISILPAQSSLQLKGYDTGPGNCLMDAWSLKNQRKPFDPNGTWAASGKISDEFLTYLMEDPFLLRPPPKSTGRETYNLSYIEAQIRKGDFDKLPAADVQATLLQFTVESIALAIENTPMLVARCIYVCGGGTRNKRLLNQLKHRLAPAKVLSTSHVGVDPDMVEACAFAWLASMRISCTPVPLTTGKEPRSITLGATYEPTPAQHKC